MDALIQSTEFEFLLDVVIPSTEFEFYFSKWGGEGSGRECGGPWLGRGWVSREMPRARLGLESWGAACWLAGLELVSPLCRPWSPDYDPGVLLPLLSWGVLTSR